jgi:hypothetical protein
MDPLIWIRLLAYSERVTFEDGKVAAQAAARRDALRRQQRLAELRVAFLRFIEERLEGSASDLALQCVGDGSHDGFIVGASNGHGVSALSVKPFDAGIRCCYWRDGSPDPDAADVELGLDGADAMRITSDAEHDRQFRSTADVVNHLTTPLLRDASSPNRGGSDVASDRGER